MPKIDTSVWKRVESQYEPIMIIEQRVKIECKNCFLKKDIVATSYADLNLEEKAYRFVAKMSARNAIENFWNERVKK
jgi:hypothetical protein